MNKKISGIGFVKSGAYQKIDVSGLGYALSELEADTISVSGVFRSQTIHQACKIDVSGVMKCDKIAFVQKLSVSGVLDTNEVTCTSFHLYGYCHIGTLQADEITFFEDKSSKNLRQSKINHIICTKLIAHDLKADTITADEVELYGCCEINTLICENLIRHDESCIVKHHIS